MADFRHSGTLKYLRAKIRSCARFANAKVQRMQVTVRFVDQTCDISIGADYGAHLLFLDKGHCMWVVQFLLALDFGMEVIYIGLVQRQVEVTELEVTVDFVFIDNSQYDIPAFDAHFVRFQRRVLAEPLLDFFDLDHAVDQLPAVTAAGAPTDSVRLDQRDFVTALGQVQCT